MCTQKVLVTGTYLVNVKKCVEFQRFQESPFGRRAAYPQSGNTIFFHINIGDNKAAMRQRGSQIFIVILGVHAMGSGYYMSSESDELIRH